MPRHKKDNYRNKSKWGGTWQGKLSFDPNASESGGYFYTCHYDDFWEMFDALKNDEDFDFSDEVVDLELFTCKIQGNPRKPYGL